MWNFVFGVIVNGNRYELKNFEIDNDTIIIIFKDFPIKKEVHDIMMKKSTFSTKEELEYDFNFKYIDILTYIYPKLYKTNNGLYGYYGWHMPEKIKAVAEALAEAGFTEWHFSQIGKAVDFVAGDKKASSGNSRDTAAILSRRDVNYFTSSGKKGFWQLKSLSDGHNNNISAIRAVLESSDMPLHIEYIKQRLKRNISMATIYAALSVRDEFVLLLLGRGVFSQAGRQYPTHYPEEEFMRDLFNEYGTESISAEHALALAEVKGYQPQRIITIGRFSTEYRYWKWGTGEILFLSVQEMQRRIFERWLLIYPYRKIPDEQVIITGLRLAYQSGDKKSIAKAIRHLNKENIKPPTAAQAWIAWALADDGEN